MAFAVVMMVTVRAAVDQVAPQICFYRLIRIAGCACAHLNARIVKSVESAAAKAAADQDLDILSCKKACQSAVSDAVRSDYFAGYDLTVFHFIYLKVLRSSEVLKDVSVFIGCCNFHSIPFLKFMSLKVRLFILSQ